MDGRRPVVRSALFRRGDTVVRQSRGIRPGRALRFIRSARPVDRARSTRNSALHDRCSFIAATRVRSDAKVARANRRASWKRTRKIDRKRTVSTWKRSAGNRCRTSSGPRRATSTVDCNAREGNGRKHWAAERHRGKYLGRQIGERHPGPAQTGDDRIERHRSGRTRACIARLRRIGSLAGAGFGRARFFRFSQAPGSGICACHAAANACTLVISTCIVNYHSERTRSLGPHARPCGRRRRARQR